MNALNDVIAIEMMSAARAISLRAPLNASPATAAVADRVNEVSGGPGHDRYLSPEIARVSELVRSGELLKIVEHFVHLN